MKASDQPQGETQNVVTDTNGLATVYYYQAAPLTAPGTVAVTANTNSVPYTFTIAVPDEGAASPTNTPPQPPGVGLPPPPGLPTDGSVALYSETVQTNLAKVGFPTYTVTTPPQLYLTQTRWDQQSNPQYWIPIAGNEVSRWNAVTGTVSSYSSPLVPDMYVGVISGVKTTATTSYTWDTDGGFDSYSSTLADPYTTSLLKQLVASHLPAFTGNMTTNQTGVVYNLASNESSLTSGKMRYQFKSVMGGVTTLQWLMVFQPDATNPDQTVRVKEMSWPGDLAQAPLNETDPKTQTYDNGSPTNWNGTLSAVQRQILRDGLPITSTNNTVWVGQQINLKAVVSGAGVPSTNITYNWGIPGVAFKDYNPDANNSHYVTNAPSDMTNSFINFYWSDGASNRVVYCTNVAYGQTNVMSAMLNVSRPLAGIVATNEAPVAVDTNYFDPPPGNGVLWFHDGGQNNPPPVREGMHFTETNSLPLINKGTFGWVQIVTADTLAVVGVGPGGVSTNTITGTGEDTKFPNEIGTSTGDSPTSSLAPLDAGETSETQDRTFAASIYLIWQPTTNMVGSDKVVWVPLRGLNWNWSGTATNNGSGWGLQHAVNSSSSLTNDYNVTNEVQWTQNASNLYL